jgi:hypothetical protein
MFQVLILVCSVNLAPADCQIETALDLINGPPVASEVMCGLHGQAYIAQTSLRPRPADEYVKVKCLRPAKAEAARRLR